MDETTSLHRNMSNLTKPRFGADGLNGRRTFEQVQAEIYVCVPGFDFRASDMLDREDLEEFAKSAVIVHQSSCVFVKRVTFFLGQLLKIVWEDRSQYLTRTSDESFFESCVNDLVGQKFGGSTHSDQSIGPISGLVAMRVLDSFFSARLNTLGPETADPNGLDIEVVNSGRPGGPGMGNKKSWARFNRRRARLVLPVQQAMDAWIKFVFFNCIIPKEVTKAHGDDTI
ncbi:unnamed protein product [Discula destructiva]